MVKQGVIFVLPRFSPVFHPIFPPCSYKKHKKRHHSHHNMKIIITFVLGHGTGASNQAKRTDKQPKKTTDIYE